VLRALSDVLSEVERGGAALLGQLSEAEAEQLVRRLDACRAAVCLHTRRSDGERGAAAAAVGEGAGRPPSSPPPQTRPGLAAGEEETPRPAPSTPNARPAVARRL
jgi:hypothetical protein